MKRHVSLAFLLTSLAALAGTASAATSPAISCIFGPDNAPAVTITPEAVTTWHDVQSSVAGYKYAYVSDGHLYIQILDKTTGEEKGLYSFVGTHAAFYGPGNFRCDAVR